MSKLVKLVNKTTKSCQICLSFDSFSRISSSQPKAFSRIHHQLGVKSHSSLSHELLNNGNYIVHYYTQTTTHKPIEASKAPTLAGLKEHFPFPGFCVVYSVCCVQAFPPNDQPINIETFLNFKSCIR